MTTNNEAKKLLPGTAVSVLPEYRDTAQDAYGWRVVEDRGERVLCEAVGLLAGSAVANPQQTIAREMLVEIPAADGVREMTDDQELRGFAIERADYFDGVRFFLASWADRSGWYCTDEDGAGYLVTVGRDSDTFKTAKEAENCLWALVEVTG